MKAQPLRFEERDGREYKVPCEPSEATHVWLHLPGPISNRILPVLVGMSKTRAGTNCWSWNGDTEKPTIRPSILNDFRPHDPLVDHIWITDGQVIFLGDCSHELAGQTVDLLDIEISPGQTQNHKAMSKKKDHEPKDAEAEAPVVETPTPVDEPAPTPADPTGPTVPTLEETPVADPAEVVTLPRYRCHKEVEAAKIEGFSHYSIITNDGKTSIPISADYLTRYSPQIGGYFVRYEDGYSSYSPAEAFEKGYSRI